MEIIARISKGTNMDQIYLPKKRIGFSAGSYIIVKPLDENTKPIEKEKFFFYNISKIEQIKLKLMEEITKIIDKNTESYENVLFTGSFLEKGFSFNDLDILIISKDKLNDKTIAKEIEHTLGINSHIINLNSKELMKGLSTDPLYQSMLSQYVAKKRFIYRVNRKMNYRHLDLSLLKSKILINNFDLLNGNEKYYLTRNMISILLWVKNEKITKEQINKEIINTFKIKSISEIKLNLLNKKEFLDKYQKVYYEIFNKLMAGIKNESK